MSLPWVKVHTTLLDNDAYRELSAAAKHTFTTCLILAGKLDCGGRLEIPNVGPVTVTKLAAYTSIRIPLQEKAVAELLQVGFLTQDLTQTLSVARFEEKAGEESRKLSNRDRQARFRNARRNAESNADAVTQRNACNAKNVTDKEKEIEGDIPSLRSGNSSSLRSDAAHPSGHNAQRNAESVTLPQWVTDLKTAARKLLDRPIRSLTVDERFIAARYHCLEFGNCTKSENKNRDRATGVAGAFATMGRNNNYADITFGEYLGYARDVHKNREQKPWFDPWQIRGVVEFRGDGAA